MKNLKLYILAMVMIACYSLAAQISISSDGSNADTSAMLDVKSSNKGLLPPRVVDASVISSPAEGLLIYDETSHCMRYFNGTVWSQCIGIYETPFSCGDILFDNRNGQTYTTVQIGTQCWMAENLNIGTMINGSSSPTDNDTIEKYCYDDNPSNCDIYGGLYQWDEMMKYVTTEGVQGICPTGWHLPTDAELCTLENEVDAGSVPCSATGYRGTDVGLNLKSTIGWNAGGNGTDLFGFTALPSGYRLSTGGFSDLSDYAHLSSSSEDSSEIWVWMRILSYSNNGVRRNDSSKSSGFSVRCVKD